MTEQNIKFLYEDSARVDMRDVEQVAESLSDYTAHLADVSASNTYDEPEASINLPFDDSNYSNVKNIADTYTVDSLQYVIVVGIDTRFQPGLRLNVLGSVIWVPSRVQVPGLLA